MLFGGQPTPWSDEQIDGLRCRSVAQKLIEEIGSIGPESAESASDRAVAVIRQQAARIAAIEAEKAERERQEPVAWCDGSNLGIDVPELQFPAFRRKREFTDAPLYANPLAIREPSDEECAAIYRNYVCPPVPCEEVSSDVELGRLMVRAVREVLK